MNLEDMKYELNLMKSTNKVKDYYLKRISIDKYELEVHHYIGNEIYCVLMNFNYDYFNVDYEIKRLKELMMENYMNYLNRD